MYSVEFTIYHGAVKLTRGRVDEYDNRQGGAKRLMIKKTGTILDEIVKNKEREVARAKKRAPLSFSVARAERKTAVLDFAKAVGSGRGLRLIAEIKKASPSAGTIDTDFNHKKIAREYEDSGLVDAISILTESKYFQGGLDFIKEIKAITTVPLLRKDFIFDEYQIYESYCAEADALLLIVAALEYEQLKHLLEITRSLGMSALVEAHSREEIEQAVKAGASIIGINARDLKTFEIHGERFSELAKYIPKGIIKIAESGLEKAEDVRAARSAGADAVLVGTSIMKAKNKKEKIRDLISGVNI